MSRSSLSAACLATTALLLGGCGESERVRIDRPILRLTLDEYRVVPQKVSVRPGKIKVVVRNTGRLPHNVVIQIPPKEVADKPVEVLGGRVKSMQPGESSEPIKVTLTQGSYRLVCTIANHDDLGQYGELIVEGDPL
ncbi:MAG: plastocyanin/azurin family copper-binding protein [Solirubrobacteraceae bacterium]